MKRALLTLALATGLAPAFTSPAASPASSGPDYVAHEWGTFTSVQGSDGVQLAWQSQKLAELPGFVYHWGRPGLNRVSLSALSGKGVIVSRQRMETPVIYFYTDRPQTVDVTVRFPEGTITEWYPQANRIGPIFAANRGNLSGETYGAPDSRIHWSGIHLLPGEPGATLGQLPLDASGSHYFAARETDAVLVLTGAMAKTNSPEREKFLFYRGVGNFPTPLQVGARTDGTLTFSNTGPDRLSHLFVLSVHNGQGTFRVLDGLAPAAAGSASLESGEVSVSTAALAEKLGRAMAAALVSEGLFAREATAMVNTWKDSWFTEEGTRVLYLLPRDWTDARLPLKLDPAPRGLVRVMVGRAEIIPPSQERRLRDGIVKAGQGDTRAASAIAKELKTLGRFAGPAVQLATKGLEAKAVQAGFARVRTVMPFEAAVLAGVGSFE